MTTLILAEKPDQARSYMNAFGIKHSSKDFIAKGQTPLDSNTVIVGARGHLLELCEPEAYDEKYKDRRDLSTLPIFPKQYKYEIPKDKQYVYHVIREEIEKANRIIVATDPDNEGGAIAFNILRFCGALNKRVERAFPLALDEKAVQRQFKNIQSIDSTWKQAQAAIARGRSDWLIGMNLSRLYSSKLAQMGIFGNYAVGRALNATLGMICKWNEKIENFKEEPIFQLKAKASINNNIFDLTSDIREVGMDAKATYLKKIKHANLTQKEQIGQVIDVGKDIKEQYPPVLLTKGGLYKAMHKAYGWSEAKSKKIMQLNYDEHYQTYPRTDAGQITKYQYMYLGENMNAYLSAIGEEKKLESYDIPENKLKKYIVSDDADPAHLGIIPTEQIMDENADVTEDQRKMYEVVVRYALTVRMPPYKYISNTIKVQSGKAIFKSSNSGVLDLGWKNILPVDKKKKKKIDKEEKTIDFTQYVQNGDEIKLAFHTDVSKTHPLKPLKIIDIYDAGGLMEQAYKFVENKDFIKILKDVKGIGTSATRDTIVESLINKKYITINSNEEISVTANGLLINYLLRDTELSSPVLTAKWEQEYDKIKQGEGNAQKLISSTERLVINDIKRVENEWSSNEIKDYFKRVQSNFYSQESLGLCPQCNSDVVFIKDNKSKGKWDRYSCVNEDCDFVIWKHFMNKKLTDKDIENLLAEQSTRVIKGLYGKDATKKFNASLKLKYDADKKRMIVKIDEIKFLNDTHPRPSRRSKK